MDRITKAIDAAKTSQITTQQILKLENFTNKQGDKAALAVITAHLQNPQGDPRETYVKAMTARDAAEERARPYGDVGKNYEWWREIEPLLKDKVGNDAALRRWSDALGGKNLHGVKPESIYKMFRDYKPYSVEDLG